MLSHRILPAGNLGIGRFPLAAGKVYLLIRFPLKAGDLTTLYMLVLSLTDSSSDL